MRNKYLVLVFVFVAALTANCSSSRSGTGVPTAALNPVQATATTPSIPANPTASNLSAPGDLMRNTPQAGNNPVALFVLDDLANNHGVNRSQAQVASIESAQWANADLDCAGEGTSGSVNGYRMLVVAGDKVYEYHTDSTSAVKLCQETDLSENPDLLLELDPTAAELVTLAKAQVARDFSVQEQSVRLVSVRSQTWPNTGLGCPVEGQMYAQMMVPGYEIVLAANNTEYVFHTDYARVTLCETK